MKRPNHAGSIYRRSSDNRIVVALMTNKKRIIRYARSEEHARNILRELLGENIASLPSTNWCWACEVIGELIPATTKVGHVWVCRKHATRLLSDMTEVLRV